LLEYLAWCDEPYDGVMGVLPSWAPNDTQGRFVETRCQLLADYSHAELLEFLEAYASRVLSPSGWQESHTLIPKKIRSDIAILHHIKQAVALGREEGLRLLAGERIALDAVTSGKVSGGGRKGHIKTYGTAEEKKRRWNEWQLEVDNSTSYPRRSLTKQCATVLPRSLACTKRPSKGTQPTQSTPAKNSYYTTSHCCNSPR
jgi:hypothetical protein